MPNILLQHSPELGHHLGQAETWLASADSGKNTAMLAYAALELRFAIERLAVHYWADLVVGTDDETELSEIGAFKTIKNLIYKLAGHQREIDRRFEFFQLMCSMLGIVLPKGRPNLSLLTKHWHTCSEMCHIGWALACVSPEVGTQSYALLSAVTFDLKEQVTGGILGFPKIRDVKTKQLERDFVKGAVTSEYVRSQLATSGLQAQYTAAPGVEPVSMGNAIPPTHYSEGSINTAGKAEHVNKPDLK